MCRLFLLLVERTPASKSNIHKALIQQLLYTNPHPISSSCNIITPIMKCGLTKNLLKLGRFCFHTKTEKSYHYGSKTPVGFTIGIPYPPQTSSHTESKIRWNPGYHRLAAEIIPFRPSPGPSESVVNRHPCFKGSFPKFQGLHRFQGVPNMGPGDPNHLRSLGKRV